MSEERSLFAQRIDERKFSLSRRGYDKREVRAYLEDLEQAFRELEGHSRRTSQRVADLERDLADARASEKVSVDNAMMAVFDAKDRILERARRKADEIEEDAYAEAARIKSAAIAEVGGSGQPGAGELAAASAQAEEIIETARREAERIRREADNDAQLDVEAELEALNAQLRIAHSDTAAAKEELDAARRRIVQLEADSDSAPSSDLEEKFARLEEHLNTAREEGARLEDELAGRDQHVKTLEAAVAAADRALEESKHYVAGVEAEVGEKDGRIVELEAELARVQGELENRPEAEDHEGVTSWLRQAESTLSGITDYEEKSVLVAELMRLQSVKPGDDDRVAELEAASADHAEQLAAAQHTIEDLEMRLSEVSETPQSQEDAEGILAAARREAEEILADAEVEAEKRAATVIAKAREEADQVRQTVATLTAQAEDARSAALRSKLEAENLLEAQRATSGAGEDIVAAATAQAEEIIRDAEKKAAAKQEEADAALNRAHAAAEQVKADSERAAAATIAAAEERAAKAASVRRDQTQTDDSDELTAMLAAAEEELAISEELRRQRAELDMREQELAERERALVARRRGDAPSVIPSGAIVAPVDTDETLLPAQPEPAAGDGDDEEDPAERLSALLEAAAPTAAPIAAPPAPAGEIDLGMLPERDDSTLPPEPPDLKGGDVPEEPRSRMAWPTPTRIAEDDHPERDGEGQPDESGGDDERQSRYRSRSAQLPHLGNQAKSNMTTMANLRKKSRGIND